MNNAVRTKVVREIKTDFKRGVKKAKQHRTHYLLMLPYALIFIVFTVIPVVMAIFLSFTYFNILEPPKFIGFQNYFRLFFQDELFLIAVKNTFIFAIITGPVSYLLCLMLAWMINELPPKRRAIMTVLFYVPSISGGLYMIWSLIFSGDIYGVLNGLLVKFGFIDRPIQFLSDEKYIPGVIIVVVLWMSLGSSFLSFIAGLQGIDRQYYEAGAIDGISNRWQELWFITLPLMKPQLLFGAVMSITASFGIGDVITNLVGYPSVNNSALTIMNYLTDFGTSRFEMGYACTMATLLFIIMIISNKLVQKMLRKVGE